MSRPEITLHVAQSFHFSDLGKIPVIRNSEPTVPYNLWQTGRTRSKKNK